MQDKNVWGDLMHKKQVPSLIFIFFEVQFHVKAPQIYSGKQQDKSCVEKLFCPEILKQEED